MEKIINSTAPSLSLNNILQVKNISFQYPAQKFFKGIRQLNLKVNAGETLAVIGKSGSGKTTLLKCIYGLEDLQGGEILINQENVLGPAYNLIPGHPEIKLVSQDYYVLDNHTVKENIFDKLVGYTDEAKEKRATKLLQLLDLTPLKDTKAKNLSSGQKQRVAIARALAIFPALLLLDEPFSNLDNVLTEKLFHFIMKEIKKQNTALILITHLAEEALKYADRIAVMDNGKIVQQGNKWDVYYKPKSSRLAGLLGGCNVLKPEDLLIKKTIKNKMLVRPDRFLICHKKDARIEVSIQACVFNGKCYELFCETKSENMLIIYHHEALPTNSKQYFKLL